MEKRRAQVNPKFDISPEEVEVRFSRSSGPGGQNVNKVNSRVTLIFDLSGSQRFTESEKARIRRELRNRLDQNGCISIHCQRYRGQSANRNAALSRLQALLQQALRPRKKRKKTVVPSRAVEKRLRAKKHRSEIKKLRSGPLGPE